MTKDLFKGIALFTPGGDLIYTIDATKQERWHLDLCTALQEILDLPEPPHFLIPGYTATIDRWLDTHTKQIHTAAELHLPVRRYQPLLNEIFETRNLLWQVAPWQEKFCDPVILETYRPQFPQLWQDHDLIVHYQANRASQISLRQALRPQFPLVQSYVLRLFVSGHSTNTERILHELHELLEKSLRHPYTLKVIDVFKHPDQAELNHISATPTLVRVTPTPVRRIVGDLADSDRVLQLLIAPEER